MNPRQRRGTLLLVLAIIGAVAVFFSVSSYVSEVQREVGPKRLVLQLNTEGDAFQPPAEDFQGAQESRAKLDAQPLVLGSGLVGGLEGAIGNGRIPGGAWSDFKDEFSDGPLDVVSLKRFLQGHGFQVGEHPAFGGVAPVHTTGSWHYRNGAIDVNFGAGQSGAEMAAIDPLIPHLRELGFGIIWRSEDHWDHLHVDLGGARPGLIGTDFAGGGYGPSLFEIQVVPSR
jgi:hypothetical protein